MLILSDKKKIFSGGTRHCYAYPDDPDKVIKVLMPHRTGAARKKSEKSLKKFRPAYLFDDQLKEIKAYNGLIKRKNRNVWNHIPEFFGTQKTDMGLGIVTRLLRNHDGSLPPNLQQLLPNGITPALAKGIREFRLWLQSELIETRDLLPHNIVVITREDGSKKLYIVDGLGNSEFIPLSSYSSFLLRRKIQQKIVNFWDRAEKLMSGEVKAW
ncbi:MAG: YrbL family protein [Methyloligellaceae bacterium]